jgi:opacity protein-like surface antigen
VSASETRGGWTVAAGGEYAFTDWLTGFVEYEYHGFGTRARPASSLPAGWCSAMSTFSNPTTS